VIRNDGSLEGGICRCHAVTIIGASSNGGAATPPTEGMFSVARQSSAIRIHSSSFAAPLREDETAQTMAEYAVILTVITAAIFLAIGLLATNIGADVTRVANLVLP
jgi:Flp pilus assembly pilin Flp